MCGIAGAFGSMGRINIDSVSRDIIREIRYRGPDGDGVERFDNGFLLHLRLSIIDLSPGGAQPKWSADHRYCITFNGEIYNYKELRTELAAAGHRFETDSDTEVLIKVWEAWGAAGLRRCIGMYAFGLYDALEKRLYLARDIFGIKPLFVATPDGGMRFASTYAGLSRFPDCPRRVDPERAFVFARYGLLERDGATMVAGVRAVTPGTVETWDVSGGGARLIATSDPDRPVYKTRPNPPSFDQAAEELREIFLQSVRLHMRSDVPIGFALSGGIDSSAIVCAARMLEPDADLKTFTYVADNAAIDESKWAKIIVDHAKTQPHAVHVPAKLALDLLDDVVRAYGHPIFSMSPLAAWFVHRATREAGVTVLLNGQGSDELFGGYYFQIGAALAGYIRRGDVANAARLFSAGSQLARMKWWTIGAWSMDYLLPNALRGQLRRMAGYDPVPVWINARWVADRTGQDPRRLAPAHPAGVADALGKRLEMDVRALTLPDILSFEDRNSMASSIEVRVPFLAAPVSDFAFSMPSSYHIGPDGQSKRLLRAALRGIIPEPIRQRRDKIGYEVPHKTLLMREAGRVSEILRSDAARAIGLFNHDALARTWDNRDKLVERDFLLMWRCMSLVAWTRQFDLSWD